MNLVSEDIGLRRRRNIAAYTLIAICSVFVVGWIVVALAWLAKA
jgi:hypothetical protein